jgi:hypothetical protein
LQSAAFTPLQYSKVQVIVGIKCHMKNINYIRLILLASLFVLSGCSLVSEAVHLSVEDTKMVQFGDAIRGDGFVAHVPEAGLYLVRNNPQPGDLCLRTRGDWIGDSYDIYPFTLPAPASSLQAAWQAHVAQHTTHNFVRDYRILSQHPNVWLGSVSWFQTGYIASDILTANCVARRGTNYYWIIYSTSLLDDTPQASNCSEAEHKLQTFLGGIQFDVQQPSTALESTATAP